MFNAFLITLREGIEAALIVGIMLGYLSKTGQGHHSKKVFLGVGLAIIASVGVAFVFEAFLGGFESHEKLFEGIFMLTAVAMLTPMILWMQKNSVNIKANLERQISTALSGNILMGLTAIAFLSVFREGIETVLFMRAALFTSSTSVTAFGGIMGTVTAIVLAALLFKGAVKLDLGTFFKVTGLVLLLVAAGLTAHGIHELQEAGVFPIFIEHVWDMNHILNEKGIAGSLLKSLFGYNGNPSLLEIISWLSFVLIVGRKFFAFSDNVRISGTEPSLEN